MLHQLTTESSNPASNRIDQLSPLEMVELICQEDAKVAQAVALVAPAIADAISVISTQLRRGGRLIYQGAGTSGRLGVLDASECPPTFNTAPEQVVGLIAGGKDALTRAIEGAEDSLEQGRNDLLNIGFSANDVLVGIATSGRTPYVIGGLQHAKQINAATIGLVCNSPSEIANHVDIIIAPIVGPEVISGSTRMKAGTATKLVLNMLSTGTMVQIGKTYGNWMVDVRSTNSKLIARSRRIVERFTGLNEESAADLLQSAQGEVKIAIVMHHRQTDINDAKELLQQAGGQLRAVIGDIDIAAG